MKQLWANWTDKELMDLSMAFHKLEEDSWTLDALENLWSRLTEEIESRK